MTNSDARKRRDEAHAAIGATNATNVAPSATGPEIGAEGVEAIRARLAQADHCREYGSIDSLGISLADDVRRLLAELDAANATIKRVEAAIARVDLPFCGPDGKIIVDLIRRLRAALATTDAGEVGK